MQTVQSKSVLEKQNALAAPGGSVAGIGYGVGAGAEVEVFVLQVCNKSAEKQIPHYVDGDEIQKILL